MPMVKNNKEYIIFLFLILINISFKRTVQQKEVTLCLKDITPRFVLFYDSATRIHASEAVRWRLWKEMYDFAATPPTKAGDSIARELLDKAWFKYPAILGMITPSESQVVYEEAKTKVRQISNLLKPDSAIQIYLRLYVGGFETNAFTTSFNHHITTSVPIEIPAPARTGLMIHELVHAVHIGMGSFSGGWKRNIGTIVVTEGLAMRLSQSISPGRPDSSYTEFTPGWLSQISKKNKEVLKDVLKVLDSEKDEDIMRFTMGRGPSGFEREAYYAGWIVVGYWLKQGRCFSSIARIKEKDMAAEVKTSLVLII